MPFARIFFVILISFLLGSLPTQASVPEMYGLGSKASAMGNAQTALANGPFGFYYNPASIVFSQKVEGSFGTVYAIPSLNKIPGPVTMETRETGDKLISGPVDVNYDSSTGGVFGLALPLRTEYPRFGVGLSGYIPFDRIISIQFEQPFLPTYPMYSNRTQRFSLYAGGALELLPQLSIGGGANVFAKITGESVIRATTNPPTTVLGIDVTPGVSPVAGLQYQGRNFGAGVTYRHEAKSTAKVLLYPQVINAMGIDLDFKWMAAGSFFFDPTQVVTGVYYTFFDSITLAADILWQKWSKFSLPYFDVDAENPDFGVTKIRGNFEDTWSPKIGLEYKLGSFAFRGGYQFQPTPIKSNQPKNLNLLDSDKQIYSGGIGYDLAAVLDLPLIVDIHVQYHKLSERELIINEGEVGAPGYPVGGSLLNMGLSLTSHF